MSVTGRGSLVSGPADLRWGWAEIDPEAIAHNVRVLRRAADPAEMWAVVKADGYGHGSVTAATAAISAGATGLCVALVDEGVRLRAAGIDVPVLVLSEQPVAQIDSMLSAGLTPSVYTPEFVHAIADRSADVVRVHVNVDTGMQRVGMPASSPGDLAAALRERSSSIDVAGIYTHLACADEPAHDANAAQLARFERTLDHLAAAGVGADVTHAANSAAALAVPAARRSLVRAGIAMYGISPGPGVDHLCSDLRPALRLVGRVSHVKRVAAGSRISYGWRHTFARPTTVATVPLGYADGVPRRLGTLPDRPGADVLIGGQRHPIVGVVTMDQFMVDVGDLPVAVGDEVVLIGDQGDERVRAEDWAERLGTIGYEIVCGIGVRVPRVVRGEPVRS